MTLGLRTGSYGSLQNGVLQTNGASFHVRKPSKGALSVQREKERILPFICRYTCRGKVVVLLSSVLALFIFTYGSFTVNKVENTRTNIDQYIRMIPDNKKASIREEGSQIAIRDGNIDGQGQSHVEGGPPLHTSSARSFNVHAPPFVHKCEDTVFPPPPPANGRRIGPRPCPVCYLPVEQAIASMPSSPSASPVIRNLAYVHDENPTKTEAHGGSEFGGYPSLEQRSDSFVIKESMTVHCGFVKGSKPGHHTGFDIDEADRLELDQFHDVIVASAVFGNYDTIHQPENISEVALETVPFYMFIDEQTEAYMKNSSILNSSKRVGLWRVIVVRNLPYTDPRRNGKIPKLLLHRICPNVRYSIWIDGKLKLVVDPYQVLERFLWRQNATFAISRHYSRFDVFEEAEANKAAGKYENSSIDYQIEFYKNEGLTPYSVAKLPITSDVPEGCVLIRAHDHLTNVANCLWFNEVDRFTSRDQLSFSTVRDKIPEFKRVMHMFLDCQRRNFVIQEYHRGVIPRARIRPIIRRPPPALPDNKPVLRTPVKKNPTKRGRGERRSGSRRHRKYGQGSRANNSSQTLFGQNG